MKIYGYARVSSADQDTGVQEAALYAAGCNLVKTEKKSGTSRAGRTQLDTLLELLDVGDTLMVTRVDRLARSISDLQDIVKLLRTKGVALRATDQPVDTSNAAGKMFLDMLGVFAEFETNLRKERQLEGIAAAKARGVYKGRGRTATIDNDKIRELRVGGLGPAVIARQLNVSRASVQRALRGVQSHGDETTISPNAARDANTTTKRGAGVNAGVVSSTQEIAA